MKGLSLPQEAGWWILYSCSFHVTAHSLLTKESQFWCWILVLLGSEQKDETGAVWAMLQFLQALAGQPFSLGGVNQEEAAPESSLCCLAQILESPLQAWDVSVMFQQLIFTFSIKNQGFQQLDALHGLIWAFGRTLGMVSLSYLYQHEKQSRNIPEDSLGTWRIQRAALALRTSPEQPFPTYTCALLLFLRHLGKLLQCPALPSLQLW